MRLIDAEMCRYGFLERQALFDRNDFAQALGVIDRQPTIELPQWIPVTERLPKKYIGEWLCCDKYGNIFILRYENTTPNGDCVFCYTDNDGYSVSGHDVVAWMPLPEPWKGGES